MNPFELSEQICDAKTKALLPKYDLVRGEQFSVWDYSGCTQTIDNGNKNFFLEVKNREVSSTAYDDTTFLEVEKLNGLTAVANQYDADIFYLVFYTDCAYVFNLRKIPITDVKISQMNLVYKSKADLGTKDKLIMELPFSAGYKKKLK